VSVDFFDAISVILDGKEITGPMILESDNGLIRRIQLGHTSAFSQLVNKHQEPLYRAIVRVTRNHEDAKDVVQDSFFLAFTKLDELQRPSSFGSWLHQIARRLALSNLRRRKPTVPIQYLHGCSRVDPADPTAHPDERAYQNECAGHVQQAVAGLNANQRDVMQLHLMGHGYEEIAQELKIPIGTVRSRLHRARTELRKVLEIYASDKPVASPIAD
jgi:RNA polymerase sigma-70 factor (ECF subfamily)